MRLPDSNAQRKAGAYLTVIVIIKRLVLVQSSVLIDVRQSLALLNSDLLESFPLRLLPHPCLDFCC